MDDLVSIVQSSLMHKHFTLSNEKKVQIQICQHLKNAGLDIQREVYLDQKNIIDFMVSGLGIEVKVKGSAFDILRQCERYCEFEQVKGLMLISGRFIGFPKEIKGKPCYFFSLSRAVL